MILELAVGARCDYIVTYNKQDFLGVEQFEIGLVTAKELIQKIGGRSSSAAQCRYTSLPNCPLACAVQTETRLHCTGPQTHMKVTIDLPDRSGLDVDERYAKEALVATLYTNGKLSGHEARHILGITRRTFEEMLPRYGFSILVDSPENIETELGA